MNSMDVSTLKENYPQKYYFKMISKFMYYFGMGDCWYETSGIKKKWYYKSWFFISNTFVFLVVLDEILAHLRTDLNDKEKSDLIQFSIAQPIVILKIMIFYYKNDDIIAILKRLVEGTRSIFYSIELERNLMNQWARNSILFVVVIYITLITATVDGIIAYFKEGVLIRTEVVLYPSSSDTGVIINVLRFLIQFHWYFLMALMVTVDTLTFCSMLFYEKMRSDLLENPEMKTRSELEDEFIIKFLTGIKLHTDALWCARNVQLSMGVIYSLQVFESVALLIVCLFKLIAAEHTLSNMMFYLLYSLCLVMLTGAYMMAAGDITFEASNVPTSIFHCGWDLIRTRPDFRVLAVVAIQCSQVPVEMKAFGVITLSYKNFISVLRSSYSFFAVMY